MIFTKKAQFDFSRKTLFWMIAIFVFLGVIIAYLYFLGSYENQLTYVPARLRAELISERFVNIPECFAYQDLETGRVYSGVLDVSKFTKEQLYSCYHTEKEKGYNDFNFRLKLASQEKDIFTNNYFHKDDFTLLKKVIVKTEDSINGGSFKEDLLFIYVQVKI